MSDKKYLTVSELNKQSRQILEDHWQLVYLKGEIVGFHRAGSGHWYCTLRDDNAQIAAAMFTRANARVDFMPHNGDNVLVSGRISLYEANGNYQIILETMIRDDGIGALQLEIERLKQELAQKGILARKRKPLILPIKTLGVVTSERGAALFDILKVLKRRDPFIRVIIYPTLVQGDHAPREISRMIALANQRAECDVLIVGRGGGSFIDLYAFNTREVARAIFSSKIPIISAVGHEIDESIADLIADIRAATPSVAAELVSRDQSYLIKDLFRYKERLFLSIDQRMRLNNTHLANLKHRVKSRSPQRIIKHQRELLVKLSERLVSKSEYQLRGLKQHLNALSHRLQLRNPQRVVAQTADRINLLHRALYRAISRLLVAQHKNFLQHKHSLQAIDLPKRHQNLVHLLTHQHTRLQSLADQSLIRSRQNFMQQVRALSHLNPLSILTRGYSVTKSSSGEVIKDTKDLKLHERITTTLANGKITSTIIDISPF